jgi:cysteine desulfurase
LSRTPVYFDWNATTPPAPEVVAAMTAALESAWGNPSSVHATGRRARAHVEDARDAVAALVERDARDVVLTSGGTEANNLALALGASLGPGSVVVGRIEHPSVTRSAAGLERRGIEVLWVEPSPDGVVEVAAVEAAIGRASGPVRLVSVQVVNGETGVVQPASAIADVAHRHGALFHTDAVQAVGKLAPDVWRGADLVTVAGHKIRGPKGIGALVGRQGVRIEPILVGGAQERGLRPGTLDPVAAAGLAVAAERARRPEARASWERLRTLRDELEVRLVARCPGAVVNGGGAARVHHVANVSIPGWRGPELVASLDLEGVAVSSGSACSAGTAEPSPVITAMVGGERAAQAIRISMGDDVDDAAIAGFFEALDAVLARSSTSP